MGEVRRGVYALVLIGGLMVSCTSNQPPNGKNIITVTPAPTYVGPLHFQVLETRDTLLAPYPVRWESWSMVSQNELEFIVPSGLAICQAARVHLTELADEVRVGIEVGSKAEPGPRARPSELCHGCWSSSVRHWAVAELSMPTASDQESLAVSGRTQPKPSDDGRKWCCG